MEREEGMDVAEVLGSAAGRGVRSADDSQMANIAWRAAVYMATAGFLDEANRLLAPFLDAWMPSGPSTWRLMLAMQVLWDAAGRRPPIAEGSACALWSIDAIEIDQRRQMTTTHGVPERPAAAWRDLAGTDLWLHCLTIAAPRRTVSGETLPPPADEVEALAGLLAYLAADDGPPHYNSRTAICLAAELAARRNDEATAIALVRWWALHTQPKWAAFDIDLLARNRALAPLLLRGVLAEALRLDAAACAGYLGILLPAIAERRRHGRVLSHGRWSWKRLLKEISVRAIDREPDHVTPQQRRRRWLGRPRASAEVIAATETRLGVTLPPDYRAFLETSDGFEPWKATAPQLLPAAEIDYLSRVSDPALMDIYRDYGDDVARAIEGAIRISTDKEQMLLLLPPATNPEGDGWGAWFFAPWVPGEWRHQSFRHYMEDELRGMEARE